MARTCVILVAGLDAHLFASATGGAGGGASLPTLGAMPWHAAYRPAFPAVTCTAQATLTTGVSAERHGIICNGLYTHGRPELDAHLDLSNHADARRNVSFWEQSNTLLQAPRFWQAAGFPKKKTAMLFWQNSMRGAADIVLTPKPEHTPDGKTLTACWSDPPNLYAELTAALGPFPLHNYWSPMAGLPSSQWIAKAAMHVWRAHAPDLQLVYIPHLDFNLQRLGPEHPAMIKELQDVDALLGPLAEQVRADGGCVVILGDYGMHEVSRPILPNVALRKAGLLVPKTDAAGKLLVDYERSAAFVMADHQVAFVYCRPEKQPEVLAVLERLEGVDRIAVGREQMAALGVGTPRAGSAALLARPEAWFAHDWWLSDDEKPRWQFSVDIHNKPGFDPRELFFDPVKKCIAQDPHVVKGSHGLTTDSARWPLIFSDHVPQNAGAPLEATDIAGLIAAELLR